MVQIGQGAQQLGGQGFVQLGAHRQMQGPQLGASARLGGSQSGVATLGKRQVSVSKGVGLGAVVLAVLKLVKPGAAHRWRLLRALAAIALKMPTAL